MDDWMVWGLLVALGFNLAAGGWNLVAATRHARKVARLEREAYGARPLLSDNKMATLQPGDTVLMLLPLDGATVDRRDALIDSIKALIVPARERGIKFLAKQRAETVQIDPAKTYKECFFNRGVFMALEAAFRSPEPLYSRDSQEYREMVRAF